MRKPVLVRDTPAETPHVYVSYLIYERATTKFEVQGIPKEKKAH